MNRPNKNAPEPEDPNHGGIQFGDHASVGGDVFSQIGGAAITGLQGMGGVGKTALVLRLTASLLRQRRDLSPADFLRRLEDESARLALTGAEASLRLSYDLLDDRLQELWRRLAVFPESFDASAAAGCGGWS